MRNLSDEAKKNKQRYDNEYSRNNYDRVLLTLPRGEKEGLQAHAAERGESLNAFINRAIRETVERDNTK